MQIAPARVEHDQDETTWARLNIDSNYARRHLDGRSFDLFLTLKCDVIPRQTRSRCGWKFHWAPAADWRQHSGRHIRELDPGPS